VSDEGKIRVVSELLDLFVDHKTNNSELGGTAVVQLDRALGKLGLFIEFVPSVVDPSVTEVTNEFVAGTGDVLHEGDLEETNEADHLANSVEGDGVGSLDGGQTVGEGAERMTGVVNVTREVDSGTGEDVSEEGQLSNTSVLDLDVTETVETFLIGAVEETKGIPASKRSLDTKLVLESTEGGGGHGLLGRGKGGGAGEEGGNDSELHGVYELLKSEIVSLISTGKVEVNGVKGILDINLRKALDPASTDII
jgi:hypothetical protein